jgi:peptide/nickel transport system ATP-binding protein
LLPLIQIKNLTVVFPGVETSAPALQNFSMELNRGEMLAVVGESGSGKSVMSLAMMNLLTKTAVVKQGSVLLSTNGKESVELLGMPEKIMRNYRGNQMSMIFQEPMTSLNPVMTCGVQVMEPLIQHKKLNRSQAKKEALLLFEKVQLPDPMVMFNRYPHQLSGGQKQRVMIAMAISCNPSLLICDEPTTALDVRVQRKILDLLKDLRKSENIGMIFITHDLGLVRDMADRAMVMFQGRVMEEGSVEKIFDHPGSAYTRGLLMCRPALHTKGERLSVVSDFVDGERVLVDGERLTVDGKRETVNRQLSTVSPQPVIGHRSSVTEERETVNRQLSTVTLNSEILVRVNNLNLKYSSGKNWLGKEKHSADALQDINFEVYRGETLGLVGESGSGKTTLGRALLGLNKPYRGSIQYGNTDLLTMKKAQLLAFRRNIQIVFQDPYSSLNPRLMIGPAVAEPLKVHDGQSRSERKTHVLELLQKVNLKPEYFSRYPHAFSGGQRQRIVIARALALDPGFVVFDESVSALDVSVQAQILNLINDLKEKMGFTAVFISHDLSVIRYLCDRVMVMEKGRIVESGDVETVYLRPRTAYTRSLVEAIPGAGWKS